MKHVNAKIKYDATRQKLDCSNWFKTRCRSNKKIQTNQNVA